MMAHTVVQNNLTLQNDVNVLHSFSKLKSFVFYGHFAFSSIQTVHVFIMVFLCLLHNILVKFVS